MANTAMPNVMAQGPAQAQGSVLDARKSLQRNAAKRGAKWFYWIAGLSIINSVIMANGSNTHFVVGLGITEVFDAAGRGLHGSAQTVALGFSLAIAGIFVLFGYFANKMQQWAFVLGMALYALDALLLVSFSDMPSAGFHALVLFFLFKGLTAARNFAALKPANAPLG